MRLSRFFKAHATLRLAEDLLRVASRQERVECVIVPLSALSCFALCRSGQLLNAILNTQLRRETIAQSGEK